MTELRWIPQAREFARRGRTAVIVMRREFGGSGGGYGRLRREGPGRRRSQGKQDARLQLPAGAMKQTGKAS